MKCKVDQSAYTALVKEYSACVFGVCFGMLGNRHDAEDLAQQTLLKGFSDIHRLKRVECFGPWIIRIAKNLCLDFMRDEKRKRKVLDNKTRELVTDDAVCRDNDSSLFKLQSALTQLDKEYRLPLMLYYFDGQSAKSVAEELNISVAAAFTRISRARKKLRTIIGTPGGAS
ncbi:MAG: sigma-70 family RNA polymerase sigma factor [Planctomycetes bacterium]|nr:sigma-70 family RNA polymerase sigma factor [Planctomycetota bacterium]